MIRDERPLFGYYIVLLPNGIVVAAQPGSQRHDERAAVYDGPFELRGALDICNELNRK